jgi:hypothetical protein
MLIRDGQGWVQEVAMTSVREDSCRHECLLAVYLLLTRTLARRSSIPGLRILSLERVKRHPRRIDCLLPY